MNGVNERAGVCCRRKYEWQWVVGHECVCAGVCIATVLAVHSSVNSSHTFIFSFLTPVTK
jgi:hypothetical protein